jgi:hypothetical protein
MDLRKFGLAGVGAILLSAVTGCGLVQGHVDCDQVSQQQRGGQSDNEIAQASGLSLDQVQSCSQTGSSGGRETANNYQDQPHLPIVPMISGGALGGGAGIR